MTARTKQLLEKLEESVYLDSFIQIQYEVCEQLERSRDRAQTVEPILKLMESHSDADFGMPGPLVQLVESIREYEEKLLASLKRKPTPHTLWMLNRILNDTDDKSKAQYLKALDKVIARKDLDDETRAAANDFRELH